MTERKESPRTFQDLLEAGTIHEDLNKKNDTGVLFLENRDDTEEELELFYNAGSTAEISELLKTSRSFKINGKEFVFVGSSNVQDGDYRKPKRERYNNEVACPMGLDLTRLEPVNDEFYNPIQFLKDHGITVCKNINKVVS
jgi:hypothetical protein